MKRAICLLLIISVFCFIGTSVFATASKENENLISVNTDFKVNAKSAMLMEANTGKILFMQNEDEKASPASVTKIMTLLLVMEALQDGRINEDDKVLISDYAASMGGSQVFLEEGEEMTVKELIKCTVIASANDAAVALAEHVCGSEKIFVTAMNKRADELGMENTNFENVTGLDDTTANHVTSAEDIAIMSRELLKHDMILEFSSLWQDTIRNGEFTLTNTNRLVRYYDGCNGLKTGSTDKAGYCMSATAKRDGMQLIAVIMGAPTRDVRNAEARALLDFGFSNYAVYSCEQRQLENIPIYNGVKDSTTVYAAPFYSIIPKAQIKNVDMVFEIPKNITAPVKNSDCVGKITYKLGDTVLGVSDIYVSEDIEEISFWDIFLIVIKNIFAG
jgi:D-alanyl-D-alanine carboxypeptidase (penicillin-binding protein 5/6)